MGKSDKKEDAGAKSEAKPRKVPEESRKKRISIVRIGGRDLDSSMKLISAITMVRGVSYTLANAISKISGLGEKDVGELSEDEIKKLEDMMQNPAKYGVPEWMLNRRADPEHGANAHNVSAQLELRHKMDINELKKGKSYRGIRHITHLPVRGQRTRSSFRKSTAVGVSRSKAKK
ncbi:MAG: 30S ribosomal protein S13 [Candidatus Aenigmarchaeota archaeon]|nr:30S ribosomal protein S13 [Candidatus Aenigmarchaeota archaeon]